MLDQRDVALLHDIKLTSCLNHIMAVEALWHAWKSPDRAAEWTYAAMHQPGPITEISKDVLATYRDEVGRRNEVSRARGILLAKIFVEAMASYEDLAAFCFAIDHRKKQEVRKRGRRSRTICGLFEWYLDSQVDEVRKLVDHIQAVAPHPGSTETLDQILDLPALGTLQALLAPTELAYVTACYKGYPATLRGIFSQYREPSNTPGMRMPLTDADIGPGRPAHIGILINVLVPTANSAQPANSPGQARATSDEVLIHAFNKLKHRFMVTDDLRKYSYAIPSGSRTLSTPAPEIEVGRLPITEEYIMILVQNTVTAGKTVEGLAHLLMILDLAGINLYN